MTTRRVLFLAISIALLTVAPAAAEEEADRALSVRIYDLRALTESVPTFSAPRLGGVLDPLFRENVLGSPNMREAPSHLRRPWHALEALIEHLQTTGRPEAWDETPGALISALGEQHVLVFATQEMFDALEAELHRLLEATRRTYAVEIAVAANAESLAAATRVRLVAKVGQRVAVWSGAQRGYVRDYGTEVA